MECIEKKNTRLPHHELKEKTEISFVFVRPGLGWKSAWCTLSSALKTVQKLNENNFTQKSKVPEDI